MYHAKQFNLSGLTGISDQTLEMHFKLYEGYVKETNNLQEKISNILKDGKVDQEEMPAYSELKRRLGFEYNGMVLHEYYFGNLTKGGTAQPEPQSAFMKSAVEASAALTFGKPILPGSARCAASVGRSAIRTQRAISCRITGFPCTRSATSRDIIRYWLWTSGSMRFSSTTNRRSAPSTSKHFSAISIGKPSINA